MMRKFRPRKKKSVRKNERGAALFTAIFGLLLLTLLATSIYLISDGEKRAAINYGENAEAFYIAEAGLAHAVGLYAANGKDYDITTAIPAGGVNFGAGKYTVQSANGAIANTKVITSVGTGKNGASATVETVVQFGSTPVSDAAVVVNGNVSINANIQVLGQKGIIHTNGSVTLSGNNRAEKYFSATGTITGAFGQPCPNGSNTGAPPGCDAVADVRQNQPPQPVPDIKPTDFSAQADYLFYPQNGATPAQIRDKAGNVVATNCQSGCWGGWTWNSSQGWVANSGSTMPAGTYYAVQSSFQINRTFGASGTPLDVSFIADGSVSFSSGASYMTGKATKDGRKFAVVAGADVSIGGANINTTNYESTFYARHQFYLGGGQPVIYGNIAVYNEDDTALYGQNVVLRQSGVAFITTGDPKIIFNGNGASSGTAGAITISQWREIRN
ncbi:MAG: hypothetical protein JSS81_24810 [Acidobacteria bacterium]|nr:hypothetical protein [Acidobacteriota bacterium]